MLMAAAPAAMPPKKPRRVVWSFSCFDIVISFMVNKWCYENFEKATKKDNDNHKIFL
jgi:hypothetical protein